MKRWIVAAALVIGAGGNALAVSGDEASCWGARLETVAFAGKHMDEAQSADEAASFDSGFDKPGLHRPAAAFDRDDEITGSIARPGEDIDEPWDKPSAMRAPAAEGDEADMVGKTMHENEQRGAWWPGAGNEDYTGSIDRSERAFGKPMAPGKAFDDDEAQEFNEDPDKPVKPGDL